MSKKRKDIYKRKFLYIQKQKENMLIVCSMKCQKNPNFDNIADISCTLMMPPSLFDAGTTKVALATHKLNEEEISFAVPPF